MNRREFWKFAAAAPLAAVAPFVAAREPVVNITGCTFNISPDDGIGINIDNDEVEPTASFLRGGAPRY